MLKNNLSKNMSNDDKNLLEVINASCLTVDDIKWLKNKRWFKRFIKIYAKELKKRYNGKEVDNKKIKTTDNDIEVLNFAKELNVDSDDVVEILDFTKTIDITEIKNISEATNKAKKKVQKEKMFWWSLIGICGFMIVILCVVLINWYLENKKTDDMLDDIYEVAEIKTTTKKEVTTKSNVSTTTKLSDYYKYKNMNMFSVNFDNLKNINPDTKGWINVPGTNINYPFVQSDNNEYYLKHSFDKTSTKKGWVFLDYRNNINDLSRNTVLYAHGAMNNTMFGSMRWTLKPSWYNKKNNRYITVLTPDKKMIWEVFSVYTIEPESYYITTKFNDSEFEQFINIIKSRSINDFGVGVGNNDKILTLSSCYDKTKRMVMHAKLISIE